MYRTVDCGTWNDPWFSELDPEQKLVFFYVLTNPRSTPAGCFEITIRAMSFETGITIPRLNEILASFGDRVVWWPDLQVIWMKNFYRRQNGDKPNPKYREGARRSLIHMPDEVQERVVKEYPELASAKEGPSSKSDAPSGGTEAPYKPLEGASTVIGIELGVVTGTEEERSGDETPPNAQPDEPTPVEKPKPQKRACRIPEDFSASLGGGEPIADVRRSHSLSYALGSPEDTLPVPPPWPA